MSTAPENTVFSDLLADIMACRLCEDLPLGPKPVVQLNAKARILLVGQAPGKQAHEKSRPFADASGDRLRFWLGIDEAEFYDATKIAVLPMGFCYPGKAESGDMRPRKVCSQTWHSKVLERLKCVELTLIVGNHALQYFYPNEKENLTQFVREQSIQNSKTIVLPHPSPRNNVWLHKNPWFERDILPQVRQRIEQVI